AEIVLPVEHQAVAGLVVQEVLQCQALEAEQKRAVRRREHDSRMGHGRALRAFREVNSERVGDGCLCLPWHGDMFLRIAARGVTAAPRPPQMYSRTTLCMGRAREHPGVPATSSLAQHRKSSTFGKVGEAILAARFRAVPSRNHSE